MWHWCDILITVTAPVEIEEKTVQTDTVAPPVPAQQQADDTVAPQIPEVQQSQRKLDRDALQGKKKRRSLKMHL